MFLLTSSFRINYRWLQPTDSKSLTLRALSYLSIWLHCVWTTNKRIPYLRDEIRNEVILHIHKNAKIKGIYIDHINGYHEHLHALISLGSRQTVSEIMQNITSRGVCWSTNQLSTIQDNKTTDGAGGGIFSSIIRKFLPLTTYYVRAYVTNGLGTSYGNQVSFITPCVLDSWYGATNLSSKSLDLSGLDENTTYYWKVKGWNSRATCDSATSNIWKLTTVPQITLPSVSTTPVTKFTSTTAIVGGNVTSDGYVPVERGVYWGLSPNPEMTGTKLQIGNDPGYFSTTLTGLIPKTTYYIKAYAINSIGTSYGSQVSFNTGENTTLPTISDIEGNTYQIVTIGTQTWMAQNLRVTKYQDGSAIPNVTDQNIWSGLTIGAYCNYNNNPDNGNLYGRLYNFYTVVDSRKLCPSGWHVPTGEEWTILTEYLINSGYGYQGSGSNIGKSMASTSGWTTSDIPGTVGNDQTSNNTSGFSALPGGMRTNLSGLAFDGLGKVCLLLTSSQHPLSDFVWRIDINYYHNDVVLWGEYKNCGFSVRCVKDN